MTGKVREADKGNLQKGRIIAYGQAVKEALAEELHRDPTVFVMGEDVAEAGTAFKVFRGLVDEFGSHRVIDSPISEAGITGLGGGASMTGMHPVVDIMFGDFITLNDPKGLLKVSIRDDNPVALFEDKMMYQTKGHVPAEEYIIPLGQADIKRVGDDLTLVATSSMVNVALEAAEQHAELDISTEVVDPRTTLPLDQKTIIASAKKTSRAIVVDEGYQPYGVTAKIASVIADGAFLLSGCSRQTDGGYECAYSLLASIRGPNRTDSRAGHGISEGALRASIDR